MWHVYILETISGQLYTGMTNDLVRRMKEHQKGKGSRFMRTFGFKQLLYSEELPTRVDAMRRESLIKTWPRVKKQELANGIQKKLPKKTKKKSVRKKNLLDT